MSHCGGYGFEPQKKTEVGDLKCKTCKYHRYIISGSGKHVCCYYIVMTGHRRPCKAGDECTVYERRERRARINPVANMGEAFAL